MVYYPVEYVENDGEPYWIFANEVKNSRGKKVKYYTIERPALFKCHRCGNIVQAKVSVDVSNSLFGKELNYIVPTYCDKKDGGCGRQVTFEQITGMPLRKNIFPPIPIHSSIKDKMPRTSTNVGDIARKLPKYKGIPKEIKNIPRMINSLFQRVIVFESDVWKEMEYIANTLAIIGSWKRDAFDTMPYLGAVGEPNVGKTQYLLATRLFVYHGILSTNITASAIPKVMDVYKATLLMDEIQNFLGQNTEASNIKEGILKSGYKRGIYYVKSDMGTENANKVVGYDVFGLKAFTSTKVANYEFAGRTIVHRLEERQPEIEHLKEIEDKAYQIRGLLNIYKFLCPDPPYLSKEELNGLHGRTAEIFDVPLRIAKQFGIPIEGIIEYAKEHEKKVKESLYDTSEASVLNVIYEMMREGNKEVMFVSDIAVKLRWFKESGIPNSQLVGYKLKNLDLKVKAGTGNKRVLDINYDRNKKRLEYLFDKYRTEQLYETRKEVEKEVNDDIDFGGFEI